MTIFSNTPLPQKLTRPFCKNKKIQFFFNNSHDLPQKKITRIYRKKKLHDSTIFLYTTYIFHLPRPPLPLPLLLLLPRFLCAGRQTRWPSPQQRIRLRFVHRGQARAHATAHRMLCANVEGNCVRRVRHSTGHTGSTQGHGRCLAGGRLHPRLPLPARRTTPPVPATPVAGVRKPFYVAEAEVARSRLMASHSSGKHRTERSQTPAIWAAFHEWQQPFRD